MWKWLVVLILLLSLASAGCCTDFAGILSDAKAKAIAGDYATAITLCNGVINQHPGAPVEPKALLLLGHILSKQKGTESILVSQFGQVVDRFPKLHRGP